MSRSPKKYLPNPSVITGTRSTRQEREESFSQMSKDDLMQMADELLRKIAIDAEWHNVLQDHRQRRKDTGRTVENDLLAALAKIRASYE